MSSQVRCTPKPRPEENLVSYLMDVIGSGGFETWLQNVWYFSCGGGISVYVQRLHVLLLGSPWAWSSFE